MIPTCPTWPTWPTPIGVIALALVTSCAATVAAQTAIVPAPPPTAAAVGAPRDNPNTPQPTGTGRIRGRVVDADTGAPLQDTLLRLTGGGLRESPAGGTDENGRFEFENLPAGRYTLTANKPGYMTLAYGQRRAFESGRPIELADKQTLDGVDFAVPRGGVIVARVTDENGEPVSGVRVTAQRYRFSGGPTAQRTLLPISPIFDGTDDRGELRVYGLPPGEYYVATSSLGSALNAAANGASYVATFYPGTTSVDAAQRVEVQIGKEVHVSIPLVAARMARVSGVVKRADGSPAVRMTSASVVSRTSGLGTSRGATVQPNGTFTITDVAPGEYFVQASFNTPQQAEREQGRVQISLNGTDVTGIVVPMAMGGTMRGRVSFEPQRPSNLRPTTLQPYLTSGPTIIGGPPVVQDDGTFAISGVFDSGMVRVLMLPPGWFLKAVRIGDRDITDAPISVDGGSELTGVEIVLTQIRSEINGGAADAKGATVTDYAVVVFPDDRSQWTPASRFIASTRPDQEGRFKLPGLPAGKYLAAAVDYIEAGSERDPDLLQQLRERATVVTVGDGEAKTVTLSVQ